MILMLESFVINNIRVEDFLTFYSVVFLKILQEVQLGIILNICDA